MRYLDVKTVNSNGPRLYRLHRALANGSPAGVAVEREPGGRIITRSVIAVGLARFRSRLA
jgi:hypothetical protein